MRIWKTILATQHHDVYCFCGPEIKAKSIQWLKDSQKQTAQMIHSAAAEMLSQIAPLHPESTAGDRIQSQSISCHGACVRADRAEEPAIYDKNGNQVACEVTPMDRSDVRIKFLAENRAFGYTSYELRQGVKTRCNRLKVSDPYTFTTPDYQCTLLPDGTISSLKLMPDALELLDPEKIRGNQLAGQDSTGLGTTHEGTINIGAPGSLPVAVWEPPTHGPELNWQIEAQAEILESPLGITFSASGALNSQVKAELVVTCYHAFPRIDFEWRFEFDQASIGSFLRR